MALRVKTRWNDKDKTRSIQDTASALAFNQWRTAQNILLNLENEGFQTDTYQDRLAIMQELVSFLIHVTDRVAYERMDEDERAAFITALAKKHADYMQDNARDVLGPGDHRTPFIEVLNQRLDDLSEFGFADMEPSFQMTRFFGDSVTEVVGDRQKKWVTTQIIDIEVPEMMRTMKRLFQTFLPEMPAQ